MGKPKKAPPGFLVPLLGAALFAIVGVMAIVKPGVIAGSGGTGMWGNTPVIAIRGPGESHGFGVTFLVIATFLLVVAWHAAKKQP